MHVTFMLTGGGVNNLIKGIREMCLCADATCAHPPTINGPLRDWMTDVQIEKYPPQDKQKHCTCIHRKCRKMCMCDLVKEWRRNGTV